MPVPAAGELVRASDFSEVLEAGTSSFNNMEFETGTVSVTVATGAAFFTQAVLFGHTFASIPKVAVGVKQGSSGTVAVVGGVVDTVTATGFTAYVRAGDDGNFGGAATYKLDWIAVG